MAAAADGVGEGGWRGCESTVAKLWSVSGEVVWVLEGWNQHWEKVWLDQSYLTDWLNEMVRLSLSRLSRMRLLMYVKQSPRNRCLLYLYLLASSCLSACLAAYSQVLSAYWPPPSSFVPQIPLPHSQTFPSYLYTQLSCWLHCVFFIHLFKLLIRYYRYLFCI